MSRARSAGVIERHSVFVRAYISNGNNATQAYAVAYPNSLPSTCKNNGAKLLTNTYIRDELLLHRSNLASAAQISREDIVRNLLSIYESTKDVKGERSVAVKSLEVLNKMLGFDSPVKVEVTGLGKLIVQIVAPEDTKIIDITPDE